MKRWKLLEPGGLSGYKAVFNPAVVDEGSLIHVIPRLVDSNGISSLGYTQIYEGSVQPVSTSFLAATEPYESQGIEDARVTKIDGVYYMTYVAWDGVNAGVAYAESRDVKDFKKRGIISPRMTLKDAIEAVGMKRYKEVWARDHVHENNNAFLWNKDAVLFPKKFNGKFAMLNRLSPDVQISFFDSFAQLQDRSFWEDWLEDIEKYVVMERLPQNGWESEKIGAGPPPIETKDGWLFIYHGVQGRGDGRVYSAGAALLDLENPEKVVGRLDEPLFQPQEDWEKEGYVNNVVFPTGCTVKNNVLSIFYGAADKYTGVIQFELDKLLDRLKQ